MENPRDVAWAASPTFVWDAAPADLPEGDSVLAMSYYPPSAAMDDGWRRSTEYTETSVEIFSDYLTPYPWDTIFNVGGPVGAMEYRGLAFMFAQRARLYALFPDGPRARPSVVSHDRGLQRAMRHLDGPGFDTFINVLAHRRFDDGEFTPKRDGEY